MIEFLYPGFLLFGAAAALPILIHLLQRYRAKVLEFSSVALLHGAERRTIRRLRLRQWLLMIVRTLILLFVALALAHPVVTGIVGGGIGSHLPTAVAILVDNSMSMGWTTDGRSLLDRSLDRAWEILARLSAEDRCILLTVPAAGEQPTAIEGVDAIRRRLGEIRPIPARIDLVEMITDAAGRLSEVEGLSREIHVLTDLQGTAFSPDGETPGPEISGAASVDRSFAASDDGVGTPPRLVFLTEHSARSWNAAVTDLRVADAPLTPSEGVHLEGEVYQRAPDDGVDRLMVRLVREDGGRVLREVELDAEGRGEFTFVLDAPVSRIVRGRVEVDTDPLDIDNRRYFTIRLPGRPRVWFPASGIATPLRTALRVLGEEIGSIDLRERLPNEPLDSRDVIVVEAPRAGAVERLHPVVARGLGGASLVIVPPDERGRVGPLNDVLSLLGLPERYHDMYGVGGEEYVRIERWGSVTGETRRFLDAWAEPVTALHFPRHYALHPGPTAVNPDGVETIDFHVGQPWIVLTESDGGWRALFATGFGREWGELYRSAIFVPLIDTLLRDLVGRGGLTYRSWSPGDRAEIAIPRHPDGMEVELTNPEGDRERIYPTGGVIVRSIGASPGNVRLSARGEDVGGYAVNPDARESFLEEVDPGALDRLFGEMERTIVREGAGLDESILTARGGRSVWRELLLLALLFLLVESILANRGAFGRGGGAG